MNTIPQFYCFKNNSFIFVLTGSSWKAFKVVDKLWVGGILPTVVPNAKSYTVDFLFGCQTAETKMFRTQLAGMNTCIVYIYLDNVICSMFNGADRLHPKDNSS